MIDESEYEKLIAENRQLHAANRLLEDQRRKLIVKLCDLHTELLLTIDDVLNPANGYTRVEYGLRRRATDNFSRARASASDLPPDDLVAERQNPNAREGSHSQGTPRSSAPLAPDSAQAAFADGGGEAGPHLTPPQESQSAEADFAGVRRGCPEL